ncbi:MAG: hypothetical protein LC750_06830 [Actinobacteria bacterium]|nr:hypothetical protein [Actinomycetota bacterium]
MRNMQPNIARKFHGSVEPIAVTVYFAKETFDEFAGLGLDQFQAYFCLRAAPMGRAHPEVVAAAFFSFSPEAVRYGVRWDLVSPDDAIGAGRRAAERVMKRVLDGVDDADIRKTLGYLRAAAEACRPEGRSLFAAFAGLPWPEDDRVALWQAAMLLREYRGDGHIAVLVAHGLDALEALALDSAYSGKPGAYFDWRQWPLEETRAATRRMIDRGFLDDDGAMTDGGAKFREMLEIETDRLAVTPYLSLGDDMDDALGVLTRISSRIIELRGVPKFVTRIFAAARG